MITYIYGDLFYSPAKVLVNEVNTVGVMSSGIAYDFKRFYPKMFEQYQALCQEDQLQIGQLMLYRTAHKWVLNFPVKNHWRANAQLDHIDEGLRKFVEIYAQYDITSASFPALTFEEEQLDWETELRPLFEGYLQPLPISIYIHLPEPENAPFLSERRNVRAIRSWLQNSPRPVPFTKFWRDLSRQVAKTSEYKTFETQETFRISADTNSRSKKNNLTIRPKNTKPIYLSETALRDVWRYIQDAGYVLMENLPNEMGKYSHYFIPLLAELPYINPVYLAPVRSQPTIGLQYIPETDKRYQATTIQIGT